MKRCPCCGAPYNGKRCRECYYEPFTEEIAHGLHTHEGSSEIVYVLSGTGKALYGGGEERLAPGDCHYCPEGHAHSLINDGTQTLKFFAVVPQHG